MLAQMNRPNNIATLTSYIKP